MKIPCKIRIRLVWHTYDIIKSQQKSINYPFSCKDPQINSNGILTSDFHQGGV